MFARAPPQTSATACSSSAPWLCFALRLLRSKRCTLYWQFREARGRVRNAQIHGINTKQSHNRIEQTTPCDLSKWSESHDLDGFNVITTMRDEMKFAVKPWDATYQNSANQTTEMNWMAFQRLQINSDVRCAGLFTLVSLLWYFSASPLLSLHLKTKTQTQTQSSQFVPPRFICIYCVFYLHSTCFYVHIVFVFLFAYLCAIAYIVFYLHILCFYLH